MNPVGTITEHGSVTARDRTYPLIKIVLGEGNPLRAIISGGIHGDEPAGVHTICAFLEEKHYQEFTDRWELTLLPCINPSGFEAGTRNNHDNIDLNRKFKDTGTPAEVLFVKETLDQPYHLDLELHEDVDSEGYYLYQKDGSPPLSPLGRLILDEVEGIIPLNQAREIEGVPAERGLLSRLSDPAEMEWWPMALYAHHRGCKHLLTLETPTSSYPMELRVQAHLRALQTALRYPVQV